MDSCSLQEQLSFLVSVVGKQPVCSLLVRSTSMDAAAQIEIGGVPGSAGLG